MQATGSSQQFDSVYVSAEFSMRTGKIKCQNVWESHTNPKDTNVMHRNRIELQNAYERIMNSRSALDEFGEIVIENDGHWNPSEVADPTEGTVRQMRTRIGLLAQPEPMRAIVGATQ